MLATYLVGIVTVALGLCAAARFSFLFLFFCPVSGCFQMDEKSRVLPAAWLLCKEGREKGRTKDVSMVQ